MTPARYRRIIEVLHRRQPDLTVILEGVHKPHNLSAIQRSCDAAGVMAVHAVAPDRPYRTHRKTAMGSAKWVDSHSHSSVTAAIDQLHDSGFHIVAAHFSDRAVDYRAENYTRPVAILMGTEKYGVSEAALTKVDGEITIPMHGMVASLNVSVAAAIILYEAERQRRLAGLYDKPRLAEENIQEYLFRWGYPRLVSRYEALGIPFPRIGAAGEILDPVPDQIKRKLPRK